ncbi:hypothetical protein ACA910_010184 [Epithemia clementina (nom. ined.)]
MAKLDTSTCANQLEHGQPQAKPDNVSRHNFIGRNLDIFAITNHKSIRQHHGLESIISVFGQSSLNDSNTCVDTERSYSCTNLNGVGYNIVAVGGCTSSNCRHEGNKDANADQQMATCAQVRCINVTFSFSAILLGPYFSKRRWASAVDNPLR